MFDASVIISFYNNINALDLILKALETQKGNFEVIIADDGSKEDAINYIKQQQATSPLSIKHVWQEDHGFRKNRILNKAILVSESDYLIFIDGDCIPQASFIEDHLENRQTGYILNGRRVDLPQEFAEQIKAQPHPETFFSRNFIKILYLYLKSKGKNVEKGLRIKNKILSAYLNRKEKNIVGCNFSVHKSALVSVNGFDNRYEAAGVGEDSDIEYRLCKKGIKIKNIFYQANVLHLMHKELPRPQIVMDLFLQTKKDKQYIALNGLEQANDEK